MNDLKFTVVTVCYNAEQYIEKTIKSLLRQDFTDYEYIIKDGGSTDGTMDIVRSLLPKNSRIKIETEKDSGIYDAMNKAVEKAIGDYIFFLNAGDYFYDSHVLTKVAEFLQKSKEDVVYGDVVRLNGSDRNIRKYGKLCGKKIYFLTGDCICHQAMFVKRELFADKLFKVDYTVCADREWQLYQLTKGKKFEAMSFPVALVSVDGFSRKHIDEFERETMQCINTYFPYGVFIYKAIVWMKKKSLFHIVLRQIERCFFSRRYNEKKS